MFMILQMYNQKKYMLWVSVYYEFLFYRGGNSNDVLSEDKVFEVPVHYLPSYKNNIHLDHV